MRKFLLYGFLLGLCAQACVPSRSGHGPATLTTAGSQEEVPQASWPTGQLPKAVRPVRYKLELGVDPEATRFTGRTQIGVRLDKPQSQLFIHGAGLEVSEAYAEVEGKRWFARYRQLNDDGLAVLIFEQALPAGEAELSLRYEAAFDNALKGLYRVEHAGAHYAFTQFEAYSARLAFPSFDEPAFKTPFDVWLTVPKGLAAVANTPVTETREVAGGYERIHFAETEPLPTYLVAFAVGPLDVVEGEALPPNDVRSRPVPLRAIAPKGQGDQLAYALQHTPPMVAELERYFGIPYPYAKLDLIAVPDFAAGAMENAGAITFRDYVLLLDAEQAPESQRRAFAYIMAHELAHQWFGNLVTMPWWDDIWLNEAFATWMGNAVVDRLWPAQRAHLSLLYAAQHAMDEDSLSSARMIRQPIETTHDIASAFDAITYSKGGAVLGMFERYIGPEAFRRGIRDYLEAHRFGTATADDLLVALSQASGKDIAEPFNSFLVQTGVPLVQAAVQCQKEGAVVSLRQRRYLPLGAFGESDRTWQIPLCLRYGVAGKAAPQEHCLLLSQAESNVELPSCPQWLMPNAEAAGYYLWALDETAEQALREHGLAKLSEREQVAFAKAHRASFDSGDLTVEQAVLALQPLASSSSRAVARTPLDLLRFLYDHVVPAADRPALQAYARALYRPTVDRLGIAERADEGGDAQLLRAEVLGFMADVAADTEVRKRLLAMGNKALTEPEASQPGVSADVLALALRLALTEGDEKMFQDTLSRFKTAKDPLVRGRLLQALSAVRDERSSLALALTLDPALRVNEVLPVLHAQLSQEQTRERAWRFLVEHFDALRDRVSSRQLGRLPLLTTAFCSESHAQRLQGFYGPMAEQLPGGPRALAEARELLAICHAQVQAHREAAAAFFKGMAKPQ